MPLPPHRSGGEPSIGLTFLSPRCSGTHKRRITVPARSVSDCAEGHIRRPDRLPGDALSRIGRRDDVIAALVNGHVIDVAVGVGVHVEEHQVSTPCRALALAPETQELILGGARNGPAEVMVNVPGETATVKA